MKAWQAAKSSQARTRDSAASANASHQRIGEDVTMASHLRTKMERYHFDEHKCFFCGTRRHHTGNLPGLGPIWLCKNKCQDKYEIACLKLEDNQ